MNPADVHPAQEDLRAAALLLDADLAAHDEVLRALDERIRSPGSPSLAALLVGRGILDAPTAERLAHQAGDAGRVLDLEAESRRRRRQTRLAAALEVPNLPGILHSEGLVDPAVLVSTRRLRAELAELGIDRPLGRILADLGHLSDTVVDAVLLKSGGLQEEGAADIGRRLRVAAGREGADALAATGRALKSARPSLATSLRPLAAPLAALLVPLLALGAIVISRTKQEEEGKRTGHVPATPGRSNRLSAPVRRETTEEVAEQHRRFLEAMESKRPLVVRGHRIGPRAAPASRETPRRGASSTDERSLEEKMEAAGYRRAGERWVDTAEAEEFQRRRYRLLAELPLAADRASLRARYETGGGATGPGGRVLAGGRLDVEGDSVEVTLEGVRPVRGPIEVRRAALEKRRFYVEFGPFDRPLFPGIYRLRAAVVQRTTERGASVETVYRAASDFTAGDPARGLEDLERAAAALDAAIRQCKGLVAALGPRDKPGEEVLGWLAAIGRLARRGDHLVDPYRRTRRALGRLLELVGRRGQEGADRLEGSVHLPPEWARLERLRRRFLEESFAWRPGAAPLRLAVEMAAAAGRAAGGGDPTVKTIEETEAFLELLRGFESLAGRFDPDEPISERAFREATVPFLVDLDALIERARQRWGRTGAAARLVQAVLDPWRRTGRAFGVHVELPDQVPSSARLTAALLDRTPPVRVYAIGVARREIDLTRGLVAKVYAMASGKSTTTRARQLETLLVRRLEGTSGAARLAGWKRLDGKAERLGAARRALASLTAILGRVASDLASYLQAPERGFSRFAGRGKRSLEELAALARSFAPARGR